MFKKISLQIFFILCFGKLYDQNFKLETGSSYHEEKPTVTVTDFTGYIATYPISMRLNINEKSNGDVTYSGYYYYNKVGTKIQLSGSWMMRPGTAMRLLMDDTRVHFHYYPKHFEITQH